MTTNYYGRSAKRATDWLVADDGAPGGWAWGHPDDATPLGLPEATRLAARYSGKIMLPGGEPYVPARA
mgnify:CR=1 FL=1